MLPSNPIAAQIHCRTKIYEACHQFRQSGNTDLADAIHNHSVHLDSKGKSLYGLCLDVVLVANAHDKYIPGD